MNIPSKALAWVCVVLLVLYPGSAMLVWGYVANDDHYGILAALFAANAGTALFVALIFSLAQSSNHTSRVLRPLVGAIGVICALTSAVFWMTDEVDNVWLRAGIISPVLVILIVLMWFIDTVKKEGPQHQGE